MQAVVIGLGISGYSAARYLAARGELLAVIDSRQQPPQLSAWQQSYPQIPVYLGQLQHEILLQADTIIVSPGVALAQQPFIDLIALGKTIIGDVELFIQAAKAPIVAITGTNAKSTVTSLVGAMAQTAGLRVQVGGNLGTPVLDLLDDNCQLYVLELSSFQLELIHSLTAKVACVLNISPDHLDRYPSFHDYALAKLRIYHRAEHCIFNRQDELTQPPLNDQAQCQSFGLNPPTTANDFGLLTIAGKQYLAQGEQRLLAAEDLLIPGQHNVANSLAALAIGRAAGIPQHAMLKCLTQYRGLPHRCELVDTLHGVRWYNDSKGTNVGAAIAAIEGLAPVTAGRLLLLAGGQAKDADFATFAAVIAQHVAQVFLFGEDAPLIAKCLGDKARWQYCDDLPTAMHAAQAVAESGDAVLLSPACASFDQFANFAARGEAFKQWLKEHG